MQLKMDKITYIKFILQQYNKDRLTPCEIAVKRGIGLLKTDSLIQIESKPKTIYSNMVTNLTNQGHLIADLKVFVNVRGTINSTRTAVRAKLPKCLSDIDFEKKDFEVVSF